MKVIRVRKSIANPDRAIQSSVSTRGTRAECESFLEGLEDRAPEYHWAGRDMLLRVTDVSVVVYRLVPDDFEEN